MVKAAPATELEIDGRTVRISSPDKVMFPERGITKLDLARYYLAVGAGALRGVYERPMTMKRYPTGVTGEFFYQKRVASGPSRPEWLQTAVVQFPSGRTAEELVGADLAHIVWAVNLGCLDLNPWPVRRRDLDRPDELRVDLDPQPGVAWADVIAVTLCVREVLADFGLVGFPKTSGSRGMHVNVRVEPRWGFAEVRRCALALAREVERRRPDIATSKWWKEERGDRVFVDYNQNARDRTVASAYSVRAVGDARVSTPLHWSEVADVRPDDLTVATVPARYAAMGDPAATIDDEYQSLEPLLEQVLRDEARGEGDAPWPPSFPKADGEPARVQPSRKRAVTPGTTTTTTTTTGTEAS
jgi:bifunctional non-homologous end joining protein LigD